VSSPAFSAVFMQLIESVTYTFVFMSHVTWAREEWRNSIKMLNSWKTFGCQLTVV